MKKYETVDHTADWALRVYGTDLGDLLTNAALGMSSLMVEHLDDIPSQLTRHCEIEGHDAESLLVAWLSELAYFAEMEQLVYSRFALSQVSSQHLSAQLSGGRVTELQKHIKAVTYHDLEIAETAEGLQATVVFDV